jgi:hypothetical protein
MPRRSRYRGMPKGRGSTAPFRIARLIGMGRGGCLGSFRASLVYGGAKRLAAKVLNLARSLNSGGARPDLQGPFPVDLCPPGAGIAPGQPERRARRGGGAKSLEMSETPDRCKITFGDFFVQERIFPKPLILRTFFSVGGYAALRLSGPKTGLWTLFFRPGAGRADRNHLKSMA